MTVQVVRKDSNVPTAHIPTPGLQQRTATTTTTTTTTSNHSRLGDIINNGLDLGSTEYLDLVRRAVYTMLHHLMTPSAHVLDMVVGNDNTARASVVWMVVAHLGLEVVIAGLYWYRLL